MTARNAGGDRDAAFMRRAIAVAEEGVRSGQTPFGACIVRDGEVVAAEHNVVWATTDVTAHAEIQALRAACRDLGTIDLTGCDLYTTCEPCPMCFAACHWARVDRIVSGARIRDAADAGFNELTLPNREMKRRGGSRVELVEGVERDACVDLFRRWAEREDRRAY